MERAGRRGTSREQGALFTSGLCSTKQAAGGDLSAAAEAAGVAATLLLAKLGATCICLGSGLAGGVFAPSLFLGAASGVWCHALLAALLPPEIPLDAVAAYAVVGAAATVTAVIGG